jgi:4-hydroxybenzoate polyprenyltransferase
MIRGIILSMRPSNWVKNLVVFAALVFAQVYTEPDKIMLAVTIFIAFCFGASAVYIINDIFDRENDKKHPLKSSRPIASGRISITAALAYSIILIVVSLLLAETCNTLSMLTLLAYMILNLAYSAFLKHVVIIDVMTIAAGFVLRAVAGGFAIEVPVSPWLLVCTILLALFLGFGKRRHELALLSEEAINHRKALADYSVPFLDQMISVVTASTVVAYAFYTLSPEVEENFGTHWRSVTLP